MSLVQDPATQPERRAYERVPINVFGRCLLSNKLEIPCQAINMSPGDIGIVAAHSPQVGETVIIYLDHIGRLEATVTRLFEGGFGAVLECTARKKEKLAASIEWVRAHAEFGVENSRKHERFEPAQRNAGFQLEDGRTYPVNIIDISLSGAALETQVKPAIGTRLTFSGLQGRVVRHLDEGIAIEFDDTQNPELFKRTFS